MHGRVSGIATLLVLAACGSDRDCLSVTRAAPLYEERGCVGEAIVVEGVTACYENTHRKGVELYCVRSPDGALYQVTTAPDARFQGSAGWEEARDLSEEQRTACLNAESCAN